MTTPTTTPPRAPYQPRRNDRIWFQVDRDGNGNAGRVLGIGKRHLTVRTDDEVILQLRNFRACVLRGYIRAL